MFDATILIFMTIRRIINIKLRIYERYQCIFRSIQNSEFNDNKTPMLRWVRYDTDESKFSESFEIRNLSKDVRNLDVYGNESYNRNDDLYRMALTSNFDTKLKGFRKETLNQFLKYTEKIEKDFFQN